MEQLTPKQRAEEVWRRIVGAGETGDEMAVKWITGEILRAEQEAKGVKIVKITAKCPECSVEQLIVYEDGIEWCSLCGYGKYRR